MTGKKSVSDPETSGNEEVVEIEVSPEDVEKLYRDSQQGLPATLTVQFTELHHHYPEHPPQTFPVAELHALRELDPEYVDRAFAMLEAEQSAVIEDDRMNRKLQMHGLWGGIGLVVLLSGCGLLALKMGSTWVAGTIFGFTIMGMLVTLVLRKVWKGTPPASQDDGKPTSETG